MPNNQLVEELHKSIIRKCKKQRVHSSFKDKFWGAYLADMQLISKYNKGFRFLLCVVDIFGKYPCSNYAKDIPITSPFNPEYNIQMSLDANKTKCGQLKAVNFRIDQ